MSMGFVANFIRFPVVLFKLSNFNSVTVIISYWFLSFSYHTLQLMCQFQFKLQLQLTVTKTSKFKFQLYRR